MSMARQPAQLRFGPAVPAERGQHADVRLTEKLVKNIRGHAGHAPP
jgi:hypothetical protein